VIGDQRASDVSQVETGNVKPEPESIGQHPGIEDARGANRVESRYDVSLLASHIPMGDQKSRGAAAGLALSRGSCGDVLLRTDGIRAKLQTTTD
jgi:hypothetical protein